VNGDVGASGLLQHELGACAEGERIALTAASLFHQV